MSEAGRLAGLDGLRAVSIMMVIVYHLSGSRFPNGQFGVTVFFVVSGFLITHLLCLEEERTGRISIPAFYWRRAFRILPPALAYLMAVLPLVGGRAILPPLLFFANFGERHHLVGQYWTLSVEEQFYLAWPTVFWILRNNRNRLFFGAAMLAIGLVWPDLVVKLGIPVRGLIATSLILRVGHYPILMGCCLALAARLGWVPRLSWWAPLLGLGWILADFSGWLPRFTTATPPIAASVTSFAPFGVVPIVHWAVSRPSILDWRPLVWIGELSYSLYLWNPLFCYGSPFAVLGRFPLNVLASLAMACVSYYGIERPVRRLRDRLGRQRAARITASCSPVLRDLFSGRDGPPQGGSGARTH